MLQMEITGTQTSFSTYFCWYTEFHHVFPFSRAPAPLQTYIFTAPTCTTPIITFEPCA